MLQIIDNLVSTRCAVRRKKFSLISVCNSFSALIKKKQRWNDDGKTTTKNGKLRGNLIKLIHYECNFLELPICNYVIIALEIEIYFLITKRERSENKNYFLFLCRCGKFVLSLNWAFERMMWFVTAAFVDFRLFNLIFIPSTPLSWFTLIDLLLNLPLNLSIKSLLVKSNKRGMLRGWGECTRVMMNASYVFICSLFFRSFGSNSK